MKRRREARSTTQTCREPEGLATEQVKERQPSQGQNRGPAHAQCDSGGRVLGE